MENRRLIKSHGEFMKCEEIDFIQRLDYHYFNLREVVELLSLTRGTVKKFIDFDDVRIHEGETYITSTDLKKLAMVSNNGKMKDYINDVALREDHYHWYGSCVDEFVLEHSNTEDIDRFFIESHIYNNNEQVLYSKKENIRTKNVFDELYLESDKDLDESLDKIYRTLSCDEHNINE